MGTDRVRVSAKTCREGHSSENVRVTSSRPVFKTCTSYFIACRKYSCHYAHLTRTGGRHTGVARKRYSLLMRFRIRNSESSVSVYLGQDPAARAGKIIWQRFRSCHERLVRTKKPSRSGRDVWHRTIRNARHDTLLSGEGEVGENLNRIQNATQVNLVARVAINAHCITQCLARKVRRQA
jgi:hypothetical protein